MKIACLICALLMPALPVNADSRLSIAVSPARSFAPATLLIRVRIDRNAENRTLDIVAASDGFYRSSEIELDGEQAPATLVFEFRSLPSGEYEVRGVLRDRGGRQRAAAHQELEVISSGGD